MHITVVGKVSTGKSSFINSFYKQIADHFKVEWQPICTMSIQRETFQPTVFNLGTVSDKINYDGDLKKNHETRTNTGFFKGKNTTLVARAVNIKPACQIKTITDFPGFDDSNDDRDCIGYILNNMGNVTIFIVDAYRPFVDKSELEYYNKIAEKSEELNKSGQYHLLLTVCNKFDYLDDTDLNEMHGNLKMKTFRWCPYAAFKGISTDSPIKNIIQKARAVLAPVDPDGLFLHLMSTSMESRAYECSLKFTIEELKTGKYVNTDLYNEPEVNKLVLKNFIVYGGFSLPDRCFSEANLKEIYNGTKVEYKKLKNALIYIFEHFTMENPMDFHEFLRYHFSEIKPLNENLKTLKLWENYKYWQLEESFRGHGLLNLPPFPFAEIKALGLDLMKIIETCKGMPMRAVNFGMFF